jgi:hypothetical protein
MLSVCELQSSAWLLTVNLAACQAAGAAMSGGECLLFDLWLPPCVPVLRPMHFPYAGHGYGMRLHQSVLSGCVPIVIQVSA